MAYPWTVYKTWVTGEVLTSSDLNNSFSTAIIASAPVTINDYSADVPTMQIASDPYPGSSESLATTLAGELERIRFVLKSVAGGAQWYIPPTTDLTTVKSGTLTIAGAKTFSTAVTINPASNQLVLGVTRTVTLTAPTPATSSRVVTFPDLVGDYSLVGTIGTQTIGGTKTFSSAVAISATSNHLVLSTASNTLTLSAATQATSARTWTVPDVSGNGTFAALEGVQTFSGAKTFSSTITASSDVSVIGDIYTTQWTDYSGTSTIVGWSSRTITEFRYKKIGRLVFVYFRLAGTSNSTSTTMTLPVANGGNTTNLSCPQGEDNSAFISTAFGQIPAGTSTVTFFKDPSGASWTASGTKLVTGQFCYETAS